MKRHKGKKFTMKIGKVPKTPDKHTLPPRPLGGIHTELTDWTERKKKKEQIK